MLIRLFKSTHLPPLFVLIILSALMWFAAWHLHFRVVAPNGMPLYDLVHASLSKLPSWSYALVGFLLNTSQAIHLNYVFNRHEVIFKQTWLPALVYLVLSGLLPPFLWFHPLLFVNSLLIFALDKLFAMYKSAGAHALVFDSAFILSLACLFYLPASGLVFLFIISLLLLRPFSWRDWVLGLSGFLLPFFHAFLYYFLSDGFDEFLERIIKSINQRPALQHIFTAEYTFSIVITGILFIASVIRLQSNYYKNTTKSRLVQQVLLVLVLIALLVAMLTPEAELYRFCMMAAPLSAYISYYLLSGKKVWLMESLMMILLLAWVYNYFLN